MKQLKNVLVELIAYFPVYRTYITGDTTEDRINKTDLDFILKTVGKVKENSFGVDPLILQFAEDVLLVRSEKELSQDEIKLRKKFRSKFQQTTGPVMAKVVFQLEFFKLKVLS